MTDLRRVAASLVSPLLFMLPIAVLFFWQNHHHAEPLADRVNDRPNSSLSAYWLVALVCYIVLACTAYASSNASSRLKSLTLLTIAFAVFCAGFALGLLVWLLALLDGGHSAQSATVFAAAFSALFMASAVPSTVCWRLILG
jgi:hypothetical protein